MLYSSLNNNAMKKIIYTFLVIGSFIAAQSVFSQSPHLLSYQSLVRDNTGNILTNQSIGIQVTILQGSSTGTAVFTERHTTVSNSNGLVTVQIGNGTVVTGTFSSIDWANGPYFSKVEVDPSGGASYTLSSTSQLMSVPYALYALTSGSGQGPAGNDGVGIISTIDNGNGTFTFNYSDNTSFTTSNLTGPQGPAGPQGLAGANGNDGIGITSTVNNGNGTFTFNYSDNTSFTTSNLTGPQGPAGATGPQGPQGPAGTNGSDGVGIDIIDYNNDGTFTFYLSDNSTYITPDLTGPQGPAGPTDYTILKDNDNDTRVTVEASTDEDIIRFMTAGTERWKISKNNLVPYSGNIGIGNNALYNNAGTSNIALGENALYSSVNGTGNIAIGNHTLSTSTSTTGSNIAIGDSALTNTTSGYSNVSIGSKSLINNNVGYNNIACGYNTLSSNTTGSYNIALGYNSLNQNLVGSYNVSLGSQSLDVSKGYGNTGVGYSSLGLNTTGSYNTAIGYVTGPSISSLSNTISIGGQGNLTIPSSNSVRIGNSSMTSIGGQVSWTTVSDKRVKNNVQDNVAGLNFIMKLKPVTYNYSIEASGNVQGLKNDTTGWDGKYDIQNMTFNGFLAQDVYEAAQSINYPFSGVDKPADGNDGLWGLRYAEFTVPLVKAVQEQQTMIEDLKTQNTELSERIRALEDKIATILSEKN